MITFDSLRECYTYNNSIVILHAVVTMNQRQCNRSLIFNDPDCLSSVKNQFTSLLLLESSSKTNYSNSFNSQEQQLEHAD